MNEAIGKNSVLPMWVRVFPKDEFQGRAGHSAVICMDDILIFGM